MWMIERMLFNKFAVPLAEKYRPCDAVKAKIEELFTL